MRLAQNDVIVVVPGIAGSALQHDGKDVWGFSGAAIRRGLLSLGKSVKKLELPADIGRNEPDGRVTATRLLPKLHLLPGLWGVDGYGGLRDYLFDKFELTEASAERPGNYREFPYDWRMSNVVSARRLKDAVEPVLQRWREAHTELTYAEKPQLIFICHSMGGLVARYYIEKLGGRGLTRRLITIGTPYRGSVDALKYLADGYEPGLGPLRVNLSKLISSFPSVYELLPTYPCLKTADGMKRLNSESVIIPNIPAERIRDAFRFHADIDEEIAKIKDPNSARTELGYRITAIKGQVQPTLLAAEIVGNGVNTLEEYDGQTWPQGDGTVPRLSAHPPEWDNEDDGHTIYTAGRHAMLHNSGDVRIQVQGILSSGIIRRPQGGGVQIGVRLPDIIDAGQPLIVEVMAEDDTLPLRLLVENLEKENQVDDRLFINQGRGQYTASVAHLAPGTYRVTVVSALPMERPVDLVTDACVVWDPSDGA